MADNNRARGWLCAVASAALLAMFAAMAPAASAQDTELKISSDKVQAVDLNNAPEVAAMAWPADLAINRPTMPMADYIAAKTAAAARAPGQAKPGAAPPVSSNVTLFTQVAGPNQSQSGGGFPPDGDIATSAQWMVQVVQSLVTMYNWNTNAFKQVSLATFFQDGTDVLFDPRVVYDPNWDRFVVLTDACIPCLGASPGSLLRLGISQTGDPSGAWWTYSIAIGGLGDFADFPQLGMDLNSIIVTFNDFLGNGGFDARTFAVAKAYLYNGKSFSATFFGGSGCTVAPPYVLDDSGVDYLMAFCPGDNKVYIGSMTNTGLSNVSLHLWDNTVAVSDYGILANAPQPGTTYTLDTGDNRFENRSLQVGSRLLNTATVNGGGNNSAPAWYNFNIGVSPHTLVAEAFWIASYTSYDWHPSINANTVAATAGTPLGEVFGTWMSTDVTAGVNVQLRAVGWIGDNPGPGQLAFGIPVYTSTIPLTNQTDANGIHRTGNYSYIALYPAAALGCASPGEIGILDGETSGPAAGNWGTHIGIVKHC
jgi:hypothetical protein